MPLRSKNQFRLVTSTLLAITALLAFSIGPGRAFAGLSGCRTDPVVILSNGAQLQMQADISTRYSDVESVVYTVHAPAGSRVVLILYTDNPLGSLERVRFYADAAPNNYQVETVVDTRVGGAQVTASSILLDVLRRHIDDGSASGLEHQRLRVDLSR
ncbi:MAG TPA: hypothetical protein VM409_06080 [Chloroflexia bacterium]|nr:hypothetical protein [Chloroflexia bacterium]